MIFFLAFFLQFLGVFLDLRLCSAPELSMPTIEKGKLHPEGIKIHSFKTYSLFGDVAKTVDSASRKSFSIAHSEAEVIVSGGEIRIPRLGVYISVNRRGILQQVSLPNSYEFLCFNAFGVAFTSTNCFRRPYPDIFDFCFLFSDVKEYLDRLRVDATNLIKGTLKPYPLPKGSFMVCTAIRPQTPGAFDQPKRVVKSKAVDRRRKIPRSENIHTHSAVIYRRGKAGAFLSSVTVYGPDASSKPLDGDLVVVEHAGHKVEATSSTMRLDNDKVVLSVDKDTGFVHLTLGADYTPDIAILNISTQSRKIYDLKDNMRPSSRSYICFATSSTMVDPKVLRNDVANFLERNFENFSLDEHGLIVCAQVIKAVVYRPPSHSVLHPSESSHEDINGYVETGSDAPNCEASVCRPPENVCTETANEETNKDEANSRVGESDEWDWKQYLVFDDDETDQLCNSTIVPDLQKISEQGKSSSSPQLPSNCLNSET